MNYVTMIYKWSFQILLQSQEIVTRLVFQSGSQKPVGRPAGFYSFFSKMVGVAGFEPAHGGIKSRCLTTWRHPKRTGDMIGERAIIQFIPLGQGAVDRELLLKQPFDPSMWVWGISALNINKPRA